MRDTPGEIHFGFKYKRPRWRLLPDADHSLAQQRPHSLYYYEKRNNSLFKKTWRLSCAMRVATFVRAPVISAVRSARVPVKSAVMSARLPVSYVATCAVVVAMAAKLVVIR
jgi:hypothetical protein